MSKIWQYYYPEDGDTAEVAYEYIPEFGWEIARDVAKHACEYDYSERDGWERGEEPFKIIVIDPEGNEYSFTGVHEPDVYHAIY